MSAPHPLRVIFYRSEGGNEPVRDWLKGLPGHERRVIGEDLKTLQFRWPLGMPLVRKLEPDLWEVRSHLSGGRIARLLFTVQGQEMALLHGFVKKSQKTPLHELNTARERKNQWRGG